jgi:uncharacterized protein (DUF305 family)
MKKLVLVTAVVVALASATAYAQMHHGQSQAQPGSGMQDQMQKMHDQMKAMHGKAHGSQTDASSGHGSTATAGHGASAEPKGDRGPSSLAFHGINQQMHDGMNITFTGNTDVDFVNGMIPHHQGAVAMAKVVLAFGNDPEIRKLAETVIRAQEGEIALMRAWLQRNAR